MRLRVADLDHDRGARDLVFRQWSELCERYGVPAPCGEDGAMPTGSFREPIGVFLGPNRSAGTRPVARRPERA